MTAADMETKPGAQRGAKKGKRTRDKLSARFVTKADLMPGRYADGGNLYLNVTANGTRSWIYIGTRDGIRRERGLGSTQEVSLAAARVAAREAGALIASGGDPMFAKKEKQAAATLGVLLAEYIGSQKLGWRNADRREKVWLQVMNDYAPALLMLKPVDVTADHIRACAAAIWKGKQKTAMLMIDIIRRTLDFGRVRGALPHDAFNVATFKGNLSVALTKPEAQVPFPSMPYEEAPAFFARLGKSDRTTAKLLQFLILCGLRANEGARAQWSWVNFDARTFTVPTECMKGKTTYVVMLNDPALSILKEMHERAGGKPDPTQYVFPGKNKRHVIPRSLNPLVPPAYTTHGFRSSLATFLRDQDGVAFETAEDVLAHKVGNKTSRAYRRQPSPTKSRDALRRWGDFLAA